MFAASFKFASNAAAARASASFLTDSGSSAPSATASGSCHSRQRPATRRGNGATHRIRDVAQTDALQEAREAQVVPVAVPALVRAGAAGARGEARERRVDLRQHARLDDAPRRMRDPEEDVRELEACEREPAALLGELARFACDEFLGSAVSASVRRGRGASAPRAGWTCPRSSGAGRAPRA